LDSFGGDAVGLGHADVRAVAGARHFTELDCWKLADELKVAPYRFSNRRAVQRDLSYREQLREAAASAPRNIAEGFGRRTNVDFARFLDIARGSLMECQNHLKDGVDRGHLDSTESAALISLAKRASGAVAALQRHLRRPPS
jgi:four helix bundle protein